jgi:hypothetical protein
MSRALAAAVVAHLVIAIVHGRAHDSAHVPLSSAALLFVFLVILAGPVVGLALTWAAERPGRWLIATTMAGSLVFGVVNHFMLAGADHVSSVAAPSRLLFGSTAVLLALTEGLGCALAFHLARARVAS